MEYYFINKAESFANNKFDMKLVEVIEKGNERNTFEKIIQDNNWNLFDDIIAVPFDISGNIIKWN